MRKNGMEHFKSGTIQFQAVTVIDDMLYGKWGTR